MKEFIVRPGSTLVTQLDFAIGDDRHGRAPGHGEVIVALARQIDTLIERVGMLENKLMENDR